MSKRLEETARQARAALRLVQDEDLSDVLVDDAMPRARDPAPEPAPEPERQVHTDYGLRSAEERAKLSVEVTLGELYDFRVLSRRDGVSMKDGVSGYVRACIRAGRIISGDELTWLTDQKRP